MLQDFEKYIQQQQLFDVKKDKILLAVSGGMDSVAMVYLFSQLSIDFAIAHCNFNLRATESDQDEVFVKALALKFGVPFFNIQFQTAADAKKHKKSIQIIARELRYDWLEKIRKENQYQYIAVGHHNNDAIETLLLNITKGCGIKGLHGILPKNGLIIRPLLFADRATILDFITNNQIDFREDSSNQNTKYIRNSLRHEVVPILKKINPSLEQTMLHNFDRFRETEALYNFAIQTLQKEAVRKEGDTIRIAISKIKKSPAPLSLLFEIIQPFGFNIKLVEAILNQSNQENGAIYHSEKYTLLKDENYWLISPSKIVTAATLKIEKSTKGSIQIADKKLSWELLKESNLSALKSSSKTIAFFDWNKLVFPLNIRAYQQGDIFYPLGMNGKSKKLSKFLKDEKLNRFEKEKTKVLCDAQNNIIWVLGLREDEHFKIESTSTQILKIEYK